MEFQIFGKENAPTLMLIPGLGVSYEIFMPLVHLLEERFRIVAVEVDGFTLGKQTRFTSVDDQAVQVIAYVQRYHDGHLDCAYGLSLGGKILSRVLERNEITIDHAILDAAPLLPLPRWLVGPLRHYQAFNVWTCYRWTSFWSWVFHSHYFDVLLDECKKAYPFGGRQAVLDGYKSVYTNKLERISGKDIHFWYGTKEAFAAKPQAKHLLALCPEAHIQVFKGMNHGQLLVDHPDEVAGRIIKMIYMCYREEAIECVKDHVLQIHKQIYAKYEGDFDRIYTEGYNSKSYTGRVIDPGKIYELSYLECTCPKVKCRLRNHLQQCECSRQSILYILSQLEPDSHFEVRIENTILRGSDRCTFRITRHAGS